MPTGESSFIDAFFAQPIDVILFEILLAIGWIPIAVVLFWGFAQMWKNSRQGNFLSRAEWVILAINVPPATEQSPKALENLFANLIGAKSSILWKEKWIYGKLQPTFSFEISSTNGYVQFYIRTETRFRDVIEAGIYAHYPDAEVNEVEDYTLKIPDNFPDEQYDLWGSELEMRKDSYIPIRTYVDFEDRLTQEIKDPMAQVLESLAKMKPGEHFWIQMIIQAPDEDDWKDEGLDFCKKVYGNEKPVKKSLITSGFESIMSWPDMMLHESIGVSLMGAGGEDGKEPERFKAFMISPAEKEVVDAVARKISKPGYKTKIRLVYIAKKDVFWKNARTAMVKGMMNQFTHLNMNKLGLYGPATPKDDYFWQRWVYEQKQTRLITGFKKRSMGIGATAKIFNTEELASLWHFPAVGIKAPLVQKQESRRAEPPMGLPTDEGSSDVFEQTSGDEGKSSITVPEPESETGLPHPNVDQVLPGLDQGLHAVGGPPPAVPSVEQEEVPHPTPPTQTEDVTEDKGYVPPNLPL